jgi:hypothetical protein
MRLKDTINLSKVALRQHWLYDEKELKYMRKVKKLAQKALMFKHMKGNQNESEG